MTIRSYRSQYLIFKTGTSSSIGQFCRTDRLRRRKQTIADCQVMLVGGETLCTLPDAGFDCLTERALCTWAKHFISRDSSPVNRKQVTLRWTAISFMIMLWYRSFIRHGKLVSSPGLFGTVMFRVLRLVFVPSITFIELISYREVNRLSQIVKQSWRETLCTKTHMYMRGFLIARCRFRLPDRALYSWAKYFISRDSNPVSNVQGNLFIYFFTVDILQSMFAEAGHSLPSECSWITFFICLQSEIFQNANRCFQRDTTVNDVYIA